MLIGAALVIGGVIGTAKGHWRSLLLIPFGCFTIWAANERRKTRPVRIVTERRRTAIPERVRNEVWNRDGGRCRFCGKQEWLEYDHIVPWSKGGPSTARNLQLLCQTCNRKKGAR